MDWTYVLGFTVFTLLGVYLVYALIRPHKF